MDTQRLEDLHLLFQQRGDMCAMPCCALDMLERSQDIRIFPNPEGSDRLTAESASSRDFVRTVSQ